MVSEMSLACRCSPAGFGRPNTTVGLTWLHWRCPSASPRLACLWEPTLPALWASEEPWQLHPEEAIAVAGSLAKLLLLMLCLPLASFCARFAVTESVHLLAGS